MTKPAFLLISVLGSGLASAGTPVASPAPTPATAPPSIRLSAAECEVWNRERSFARSVENHDGAAFAEHLHPGAVFSAGTPRTTRGKAAVIEDWRVVVEGRAVVLRWYPEVVNIGGDPDVAFSRGPYWIEDPRPEAKQRFRTGTFVSVWRRDAHGTWRVLFDGGGPPPTPATADEVAKLKAGLAPECPGPR